MNDIAASIGLAQLEDLSEIVRRRREIAGYFESELTEFGCQKASYDATSSYWLFTIKVDDRDSVIAALAGVGVESSPLFSRNDTYTAFAIETRGKDDLVNATEYSRKMLCIPVGEWVTNEDAERIVTCLKKG